MHAALATALLVAAPAWLTGEGWTPAEVRIAEDVGARLPPLPADFRVERAKAAAPGRLGWGPLPERDDVAGSWLVYGGSEAELGHALAHLAAHALDARGGWSADPAWRSLAGWHRRASAPLGPQERQERGTGPHESWRSRVSPEEELAEYAASVFLATAAPDVAPRCDRPTRFRLLAAFLERDLAWRPALADATCPAFERWIRPGDVASIELLLAASSTNHPASLWGHLLVRVSYREEASVPPGLFPVFHVGGVEEHDGFLQAWNGLTGRLEARLFTSHAHRIQRIYRLGESRSLKRFPLRLDAERRRRLLERLWELSRDRARWRYSFFTDNCAGLLVEAIAPALAPEIEIPPPRGIRFPTAALDLFAAAVRHDGGPPLVGFAGLEEGAADRAAAAVASREAIAGPLRARDPLVLAEAGARERARRLAAYREIARWARDEDGPLAPVARSYLAHSLDLETYADWRSGRRPRGEATGVARLASLLASVPAAVPARSRPAIAAAPRRQRALGDSGAYTVRAAGGVTRNGTPRAELDAAVLDEALGELRERGFRPDVAMRCVGVRVALERDARGAIRVPAHAWTFASFRSVRRELAEIETQPWRSVGIAARLAGFGDRERGIDASGLLEGGPSLVLAGTRDLRTHLAVQLTGGAGAAHAGGRTHAIASGEARIDARAHLGGASVQRLDARAAWRPLVTHEGRTGWLASAELSATIAAGDVSRTPWQFRPAVRVEEGPGLAGGASRRTASALVEITLPW